MSSFDTGSTGGGGKWLLNELFSIKFPAVPGGVYELEFKFKSVSVYDKSFMAGGLSGLWLLVFVRDKDAEVWLIRRQSGLSLVRTEPADKTPSSLIIHERLHSKISISKRAWRQWDEDFAACF